MNSYKSYWLLVKDTWLSNLIFSLYDSTISYTMVCFDYNIWLVNVCTVISILFAMLCNYFLGYITYNISYSIKRSKPQNYNKIYQFVIKYYFLVIIISLLPGLLKFIIFTVGFLRIPIIKAFLIPAIAIVFHYICNISLGNVTT